MEYRPDKPRFQKIFLVMGSVVVGIFAIAVLAGIGLFRAEARQQILQRDGVLLGSVTGYLFTKSEPTGIPEVDMLELAFDASEIEGIVAVRVFDPLDRLIQMVPQTLYPTSLSTDDRESLAGETAITRFFPSLPLDSLFSDTDEIASGNSSPFVEVIVPVRGREGHPTGAIQFWLDGTRVASEFAVLDRTLALVGTGFILGGGLIYCAVFFYARNRLLGMARILAERNQSLERANADLAIAARTSAIGSVTSHLFHDLKNPLAGLKAYLRVSSDNEEAVAVTERMQSLIDQTLMMIREEETGPPIEIPLTEIEKMVRKRLGSKSMDTHPGVELRVYGECNVPLRKVQMFLLILANLVENSRDVSPAGQPVVVSMEGKQSSLESIVEDSGPGLPDQVKSHLFEPVDSNKSNGTGVGLAIAAIIARHIPARLELLSTSPAGTRFQIQMPL